MGEVVIGTYVQCARCDTKAVPTHVVPEKTEPMFRAGLRCPHCSSDNVGFFKNAIDSLGWAMTTNNQLLDAGDWGCWACGHSWA
jgi:DNA-directed RNA polymerase subunit RPC12/RpoP